MILALKPPPLQLRRTVDSPVAVPELPSGHGVLDIARISEKSVVQSAHARSPLKFLNPRNHGQAAWIYTSTYGGGLLGGDSISLRIDVGQDATAVLLTQASTKVY